MLRTARDLLAIVGESDAAALAADMVKSRAAVNCVTEIGEAASRLSPTGRARVGEQPWGQIVGMRHIVVHVYWGIDLAEIVKTVRHDLPGFIRALESALAVWPADPDDTGQV